MALLRYKTTGLFHRGCQLDERRRCNSELNRKEAALGVLLPASVPRRLVLELTNDCNLNCRMCGRFDADFRKTYFKFEWLERLAPILDEVEEATLMGWGEPTIHPDFPAMLRFFAERGVRIYFCTNGMTLARLKDDIFANRVDIIAVSLDGPTAEKNAAIRRGADFDRVVSGIRDVLSERRERGVSYPYMNFVTTLMADNLRDFPDIIRLAAKLGLEEAKAVYLTAFSPRQRDQILLDRQGEVREVFEQALRLGDELGVDVKLPYVQGCDPAGAASHQTCHVAWRDFFVGSDGFVRPCMSTPLKFFHIEEFADFGDMWRHPKLAAFRKNVNDEKCMEADCQLCYQSSHANWNRREAFDRTGTVFAPEWNG